MGGSQDAFPTDRKAFITWLSAHPSTLTSTFTPDLHNTSTTFWANVVGAHMPNAAPSAADSACPQSSTSIRLVSILPNSIQALATERRIVSFCSSIPARKEEEMAFFSQPPIANYIVLNPLDTS
uniref:Uncharacterized protein n=1 Tax=Glossina austeni TaxID=7395 RepID=A0A1A9UR34_GLOAU